MLIKQIKSIVAPFDNQTLVIIIRIGEKLQFYIGTDDTYLDFVREEISIGFQWIKVNNYTYSHTHTEIFNIFLYHAFFE